MNNEKTVIETGENSLEELLNATADLNEVVVEPEIEIEPDVAQETAAELQESLEAAGEIEAIESGAEEKPKREKRNRESFSFSDNVEAMFGTRFKDLCVLTTEQAEFSPQKLGAAQKKFKAEMDAVPKKVREKVYNVFDHLDSGKVLSCYTADAIELLKANKSVTTKDLKEFYVSDNTGVNNKPYSPGTAAAQSGQMMALLPALGIAERVESKLHLNEDSVLINMLG